MKSSSLLALALMGSAMASRYRYGTKQRYDYAARLREEQELEEKQQLKQEQMRLADEQDAANLAAWRAEQQKMKKQQEVNLPRMAPMIDNPPNPKTEDADDKTPAQQAEAIAPVSEPAVPEPASIPPVVVVEEDEGEVGLKKFLAKLNSKPIEKLYFLYDDDLIFYLNGLIPEGETTLPTKYQALAEAAYLKLVESVSHNIKLSLQAAAYESSLCIEHLRTLVEAFKPLGFLGEEAWKATRQVVHLRAQFFVQMPADKLSMFNFNSLLTSITVMTGQIDEELAKQITAAYARIIDNLNTFTLLNLNRNEHNFIMPILKEGDGTLKKIMIDGYIAMIKRYVQVQKEDLKGYRTKQDLVDFITSAELKAFFDEAKSSELKEAIESLFSLAIHLQQAAKMRMGELAGLLCHGREAGFIEKEQL